MSALLFYSFFPLTLSNLPTIQRDIFHERAFAQEDLTEML